MARPRKLILSPTRISAYLECAMKYRYIYHDKIGRFYLRARPELSLGSTLHQVLQHFHAEGAEQTREQMAETFERRWVGAGYESAEQAEEYRQAGAAMVEAYHAAAQERAGRVETLLTEKGIRADMGAFILSGRVDRVDRHEDGTLEVVDYKSGRLTTSVEEVAGDLAMGIYQLIMRRNYPGARVVATIYCLRSGDHASAEMSDAQAADFERDILTIGQEILDRDFEGVEPRRIAACEGCEFLSACERFWRREGDAA